MGDFPAGQVRRRPLPQRPACPRDVSDGRRTPASLFPRVSGPSIGWRRQAVDATSMTENGPEPRRITGRSRTRRWLQGLIGPLIVKLALTAVRRPRSVSGPDRGGVQVVGRGHRRAVACAARCPEASTACHVRLDQLVGHSNPSSAESGTLGDLGAQPDDGEGPLAGYLGSFLIHLPELWGFRVDVLTDVVGDGFSAVD